MQKSLGSFEDYGNGWQSYGESCILETLWKYKITGLFKHIGRVERSGNREGLESRKKGIG